MAYQTEAAIEAMLRAQRAPVEAEMQAAENARAAAEARLRQQAEAENAQAYRSFERQKRELPEVMAAHGAQGGMVDSAVASMENNYMNNRNARALQLADNLADQQLEHDNAMLALRAKLSGYEQQAAADRAGAQYKALKDRTVTPKEITAPKYVEAENSSGMKGAAYFGGGRNYLKNIDVMMEA